MYYVSVDIDYICIRVLFYTKSLLHSANELSELVKINFLKIKLILPFYVCSYVYDILKSNRCNRAYEYLESKRVRDAGKNYNICKFLISIS